MATNVINGSKKVFAVRFTEGTEQLLRVLNQTGGSRSKERESIDINTKDISASDYGRKTESISFEGLMTEGDAAYAYLDSAIDDGEYVEILEINTETLEAKVGQYMISSLEEEYPDDDSATYTFEATLIGDTTTETLATLPIGDAVTPIA